VRVGIRSVEHNTRCYPDVVRSPFLTRRAAFLLAAAAVSCRRAPETKQYALKGEVVSVDPATRTAKIKHEKLGDWMEAMTMDFPVKDDADLARLKPGAQITATVYHQPEDLSYWIADVKVTGP